MSCTQGAGELLALTAAVPVAFMRQARRRRPRLRARGLAPDELHVHGYDIVRELEHAETARVSFRGDIEGLLEIELETSHVQVGQPRVEP